MTRAFRSVILLIVLAFSARPLVAQAPLATGTPPFGSFSGSPEVINLANLNGHIVIPIRHKAGRGTDFTYDLSYDTLVWYPVGVSGNQTWTNVQQGRNWLSRSSQNS